MRHAIPLFLLVTALLGGQQSTAQTILRASQFGSSGAQLTGTNNNLFGTLGGEIAGHSDALRSGFWYVAGSIALATGVDVDLSETDDPNASLPARYRLRQNYPNPFNPSTIIAYDLPELSTVRMEIFDGLGRFVRELVHTDQAAGTYRVAWDGRDMSGRPVSTGFYLYRLASSSFSQTRIMFLVK